MHCVVGDALKRQAEASTAPSNLYSEGVDGGVEGAASAEGFKYFWESAMPTAAQVIDVAARIILPSIVSRQRETEYELCALGRRVFEEVGMDWLYEGS
jgi:hypothetical protein